ncbi:CARDB domain-containing protein [Haliscomenobacter hydrossis]|uniref:Parallel beta-helix repeat protein n=1 Tax=Haliscomenobacter hydrossis (strain ATCC 27775 / DSM 1100 / LMG 10767 / O) TaxID=760192 RepID=F4KRN8_HALH1|nr:CARDB domain-containing protein [Haliscomenobacter hydrossis]AEE49027.1 parallel beta-helix repeat protein [Haliscomenobacter hydrossis DSM 1100]
MRVFVTILLMIYIVQKFQAQTTVNTTINNNTVWTTAGSPYLVGSSASIATGATLTIQPGVVVKFINDLDDFIVNGNIVAQGTSAQPIVFSSSKDDQYGGDSNKDGTATRPTDRDWRSILIKANNGAGSIFSNCLFRYGGYYFNSSATIEIEGSNATISECTFFNVNKAILVRQGGKPSVSKCRFENVTIMAITISLGSEPLLAENTYVKNGINGLGILGGSYLQTASYLLKKINNQSFPFQSYVIEGAITLEPSVNLSIEPGVVIKFASQYVEYSFRGNLKAEGTAAEPIVFTSIKDDEYGGDSNNDGTASKPSDQDWRSINVNNSVSSLKNCLFRYGGYYFGGDAALDIGNSNPRIESCTFFNNHKSLFISQGAAPSINNCTFRESSSIPVSIALSANPTFENNNFINNKINGLGIISLTYTGSANYTLNKINSTQFPFNAYVIDNALALSQNVSLTIEAGVIIKFADQNDEYVFNGRIKAEGTIDEPIIFTSIKDDEFGGDTNNDGAGTQASPQDWRSMLIQNNQSSLKFCTFRYGGYYFTGTEAALRIGNGVSPTVTSCHFYRVNQAIITGINAAPTVSDCFFSECTNAPVSIFLSSKPKFSNNTFSNNAINAIGLVGGTYATAGDYTLSKTTALINDNNIAYYLSESLILASNVSLTIDPGVIIKLKGVANGSEVSITVNGKLTARGSAETPIIFTSSRDDAFGGDTHNDGNSSRPAIGDWFSIIINSNAGVNSVFEHCQFRYGGFLRGPVVSQYGAIRTLGSSAPSMMNCSFFANSHGLMIGNGSKPNISNCTFTSSGWTPISLGLGALPTFSNNIFLRNNINAVGIVAGDYTGTANYTLNKLNLAGIDNVSYFVQQDITLGKDISLTIKPGVVIKFYKPRVRGDNSSVKVDGQIIATGTTAEPIVFTSVADDEYAGDSGNDGTSIKPNYGDWYGLVISNETRDSKFENCIFRYGGFFNQENENGFGTVRAVGKSKPSISNCSFQYNAIGIVAADFSTPSIKGNNFVDCEGTALSMALTANPLFEENKIDRLSIGAIGLIPGTYNSRGDFSLKKVDFAGIKNIPYFIDGSIQLESGFNWIIEPGVVVKLAEQADKFYNHRIIINGSIRAEGTPGESIIFTSANDDEFGGNIYSDGSNNPPERGDWLGIILNNNNNSRFKYCKFRYGGFSTQSPQYGVLRINNSSPSLLSKCEFTSNTRGVVVAGTSTVTLDSCDFSKNLIGLYKEGGNVRVKESNIFGNIDFGVQNATTVDVDATLNWWGDSTGPQHPQKNPSGKGNKVSNYVLFEPWQQQKITFKNDVGIASILGPNTRCNLSSTETIRVTIANYGSVVQTGFEIIVLVNGLEKVRENVGVLQVVNQTTTEYTLRSKIDLSAYAEYELQVFTVLNNDQNVYNDGKIITVENYRPISSNTQFSSLLPANGKLEVEAIEAFFSWSPIENATSYDLFVWLAVQAEPTIPTVAGLTGLNYQFSQELAYGAQYRWKIVAHNPCTSVSSSVQTFTVKSLPDLVIRQIKVPNEPFSGQITEITWETVNQGTNNTGIVRWYDAVFLSQDSVLNIDSDYYLGAVYNDIALNPGEGYTQMGQFAFPKEVENRNYVFVVADYFNYIRELNDNNNRRLAETNIKLTSPPDLTVSSVITPFNAFSEQFIPISYTVKNIGQGPTVEVSWRDRIYLSTDPELETNRATLLGTYSNFGNLLPGQTYTRKENIALPKGIAGKYFIHVRTDLDNRVFEYAYEENNVGSSDTMEITLTPPPDLQISSFQPPLSASNGERVTLRWTVSNLGASRARGNWNDEIYISKFPVFNQQAMFIGSQFQYNRELPPNANYIGTLEVGIPNNITGTHYFFIVTDANNTIFEFNRENNNVRRSEQSVNILSPDLTVQRVSIPNTVISGQSINVAWTVQNNGSGVLQNITRRDVIFLSRNSTFDLTTAIRLDSLEYGGQLQAGQSINRQKNITIPDGIDGRYYLWVFTDANQKIFENGSESNNLAQAVLDISLAPWPDLQVTKIEGVPDKMIAGNLLQLTYTVQNQGQGNVTNQVWKDRIYISASPNWQLELAKPLQDLDIVQSLPAQASYMRSISFNLPMLPGIASTGVYYLYVFADATNALYEHTDEGNNTLRSIPINISAPPPVDFEVFAVQADVTDTLQSGQKINVRWQVKNTGSSTELWDYYFWYDGIYLSKDQKWDAGDQFIFDWTEQGPLEEQNEYEDRQSFVLPPGISGDYFLLLVSDHTGLVRDGNPQNNVRSLSGNQAIHFKKRNYADLTLFDYQINSTAIAGQPLKLSWKVKNSGEGSTLGNAWADKAYLSTDIRLDNFDPSIFTFSRNGALAPRQEYQVNAEAVLPISAKGNYVLWLKTDANNNEFEVPSEQNNALSLPIDVMVPPPADLQVAAIQHPDSTLVGDELTVEWISVNRGTNPVNGRWQDFVYLSKDNQWDLSDRALGSKVIEGSLPPGGQSKHDLKVSVPGLETGKYHVIIQTDGLNNIIERNDTNNIGVSSKTLQVGVKTLPLEVLTADLLQNDQNLYYKIEIPDSLATETLLVTLQGDSLSGVNEIFLSYEKTPSRSDHEASSSIPFTSKQQIIVPSLKPGTYYLLAFGNNRRIQQQNVTFLAQIVPFEIRNIQSNRGGNSGTVTVKIEGGKFEEAMIWTLKSDAGQIITAYNVYFVNSTQAFVTFNLRGVALGQYDVQAQKASGDLAVLSKGFEVVEGSSLGNGIGAPNNGFVCSIENTDTDELISTAALHPPNTRLNRVVTMRIQYANVGNVDIPTPTRFLFSLEKAPISFTTNGLAQNTHELLLEFVDKDGPPGILRPGSSGSIVVYTKAVALLRFLLTE